METIIVFALLGGGIGIICRVFYLIIQEGIEHSKRKSTSPSKRTAYTKAAQKKDSQSPLTSTHTLNDIEQEIATTGLYLSSSKTLTDSIEVAVINSTAQCKVYCKTSASSAGKTYTLKTLSLLEIMKYFQTKWNGYHVPAEMKHKMATLISEAHKIKEEKKRKEKQLPYKQHNIRPNHQNNYF